MSPRARLRTAVFLVVTALPLLFEIGYVIDGDDDTWPWTQLITTYVPEELTLAAYGALAAWVPVHLAVRYIKRRRAQ